MYRVIWCFWRWDEKRHPYNNAAVGNTVQSPIAVSMSGQHLIMWINIETAMVNATCLRKVSRRPSDGFVLSQRRRRLTGIEPAMGCDAGPALNRNLVGRPTSSVRGTSSIE